MINLESNELNFSDKCGDIVIFPTIEHDITYDAFFRDYMEKNKPCIFSNFLTHEWSVRNDWVTNEGVPDVNYFLKQFGRCYQYFNKYMFIIIYNAFV